MPVARVVSVSKEGLGYRTPPMPSDESRYAFVKWTEVRNVQVFKRDQFSVDLVCLQIVCGTKEEPVELDENDILWDRVVADLPSLLPGCQRKEEWWPEVLMPPFGTSMKTIYGRCTG